MRVVDQIKTDERTKRGHQQKGKEAERRIHNLEENGCHCYFTLFHFAINKFIAVGCVKCLTLTLLSGDVWLVPVLGGVLDKLDIHLDVRITICLDKGDTDNDFCR